MTDEFSDVEVFTREEIIPIPAICTNKYRRHEWIEGNGNGAIRAPSLKNCVCFWCEKPLKPHPDYPGFEDALTRRMRLKKSTLSQAVLPLDLHR